MQNCALRSFEVKRISNTHSEGFTIADDVLPLSGTPIQIHQRSFVEVFQFLAAFKEALRDRSQYVLHHTQVLEIAVGLEHGDSSEQLEHDAPNAPKVTGV